MTQMFVTAALAISVHPAVIESHTLPPALGPIPTKIIGCKTVQDAMLYHGLSRGMGKMPEHKEVMIRAAEVGIMCAPFFAPMIDWGVAQEADAVFSDYGLTYSVHTYSCEGTCPKMLFSIESDE